MYCITDTNHLFEPTFYREDYWCECPGCRCEYLGKDQGVAISEDWIKVDRVIDCSDEEGYVNFCCESCKKEFKSLDLFAYDVELLEES